MQATAHQILQLLRDPKINLQRLLGVSHGTFSLPTDGRGARLKASVPPGDVSKVPSKLKLKLGPDKVDVEVPVEAKGDYKEFQAYLTPPFHP